MITDDELLLYYYRDGLDAAERARIGAALSEQPELAQRLQGLVARLDAAAAMPEVPVPELCSSAGKSRWSARHSQDDKRDARAPRAGRRSDLRWPAAAAAALRSSLSLLVVQVRNAATAGPDRGSSPAHGWTRPPMSAD